MTVVDAAPTGTGRAERITVFGVVQGVGFRPFVARLAAELGIAGSVWNSSTAVYIDAAAPSPVLDEFARRLVSDAPPLARVTDIARSDTSHPSCDGFRIVDSHDEPGALSIVPADAAVCSDCLVEVRDPANRRYEHPFITCTNCGPRFTIIRDLPYDRPATTMANFEMCPACRAEYVDALDRRHHAQPIACHDCGPTLAWVGAGDDATEEPVTPGDAIDNAVDGLASGSIIAIKGLGGFQLVCRADDDVAVHTLRNRKHRPDKPLAVMVADVDAATRLARVSDLEASELASSAAPIVLLDAVETMTVAPSVAPDNPLIGVMLPSTPLHHLIFDRWSDRVGDVPLVVTSANASGAPICHRDDELDGVVLALADAALTHDRPIHVACDDSVVREIDGVIVPLRRARGFAPMPIDVGGDRTVLGIGGELKNTVALVTNGRAHVSQHVGDIEHLATFCAFEQQINDLTRFHGAQPDLVVADLHPGYLGTRWAQRSHGDRLQLVQHHHAHIAAVMAEHGLDPHRPVVGVAFDGTGYATDGTIWGGEFLLADADGFERIAHLEMFQLPGGDAAVREPWRVAAALIQHAGLDPFSIDHLARCASAVERTLLVTQLERGIGCAMTSSMGRLFDGVASVLGIRHRVTFEAHAAIELEIAAGRASESAEVAPLELGDDGVIRHGALIASLVDAVERRVDAGALAAGFHDAVADVVVAVVQRHRHRSSDDLAVLSGGVFQNARLVTSCRQRLAGLGIDVRSHQLVPPNDGGLALGHAWIGAHASHLESTRTQQTRNH